MAAQAALVEDWRVRVLLQQLLQPREAGEEAHGPQELAEDLELQVEVVPLEGEVHRLRQRVARGDPPSQLCAPPGEVAQRLEGLRIDEHVRLLVGDFVLQPGHDHVDASLDGGATLRRAYFQAGVTADDETCCIRNSTTRPNAAMPAGATDLWS
eukprot:CAMPEP_0195134182 /NCGR_PEP_ID=MMETSP0448-20130528/150152_1 /TAXON_ID=66468 /ORGANISM="Heterocapsa triquestra, Strain CCMP 448" /LENGTH=153 /DNA_ID=CAMNT_0040172269 /DNA_START=34 /DNA_END=492 /DNA_ORIENTATION=-